MAGLESGQRADAREPGLRHYGRNDPPVDAQLAVKRSELLSFLLSSIAGVVSVAALNIRNLDETVKRRLQLRAARHGRSMEAEVRAILAEAVREPADSAGLFTTLLDRFGALGGVDLDLPGREEPARAAEFSA
jgi:plasmid stability protein